MLNNVVDYRAYIRGACILGGLIFGGGGLIFWGAYIRGACIRERAYIRRFTVLRLAKKQFTKIKQQL
jgi:hypothetical protein